MVGRWCQCRIADRSHCSAKCISVEFAQEHVLHLGHRSICNSSSFPQLLSWSLKLITSLSGKCIKTAVIGQVLSRATTSRSNAFWNRSGSVYIGRDSKQITCDVLCPTIVVTYGQVHPSCMVFWSAVLYALQARRDNQKNGLRAVVQ